MYGNYDYDLAEVIKDSVLKHENKDAFRKCAFYFSTPEYDRDKFFNDPHLERVREIIKELGYECNPCDTVPHAFCLNQDFDEVECDKAIREFGYTLPYSHKYDLLAELCDLVWFGKVMCICYWEYKEGDYIS